MDHVEHFCCWKHSAFIDECRNLKSLIYRKLSPESTLWYYAIHMRPLDKEQHDFCSRYFREVVPLSFPFKKSISAVWQTWDCQTIGKYFSPGKADDVKIAFSIVIHNSMGAPIWNGVLIFFQKGLPRCHIVYVKIRKKMFKGRYNGALQWKKLV
jgi:hypothetical protein